MKRWSSLRRTDAPIPVALMAVSPISDHPLFGLFGGALSGARLLTHGPRPGRNGLHDIVVAGATAEIALELVPDGLVVELVTLAVHDVDRRHDHARRAIAALQAMMLAERLVHGMQGAVLRRQAFDRGHVRALDLPGKDGAC